VVFLISGISFWALPIYLIICLQGAAKKVAPACCVCWRAILLEDEPIRQPAIALKER